MISVNPSSATRYKDKLFSRNSWALKLYAGIK